MDRRHAAGTALEPVQSPNLRAGSPAVTVSVRAPATAGGPISLITSLTPGCSGNTVRFVAYPAGGGPGIAVAHAVVTGSSARATWLPAPEQSGTFQVRALLLDHVFGSIGFPYASAVETVIVTAAPSPARPHDLPRDLW